jgi:hypothetical protein
LDLNFEHGTRIRDREVVDRVRDDIQKLTLLGSFVSREAMASYTVVTEEARRIYQLEYHRLRRNVSKALGTALDQAERTLLRLRLKEGAMHTIFADAILYLLDRYGPLQTPEVHQFVQRIYPDLCDDTVDRVIDGWHYGKRWKHAVSTAQQHLKRRGLVDYRDARWQLSSIPHRT